MLRITFVRHGPTSYNRGGLLRGWMNPPLDSAGLEAAGRMSLRPAVLYSSDLLRARQTAESIGVPVLTRALRPWNVGVFAGCPAALCHPRLVEYRSKPETAVPFGEPYVAFVDRFVGFLESLTEDCTLVTHYRNFNLVFGCEDVEPLDVKEWLCDGPRSLSWLRR